MNDSVPAKYLILLNVDSGIRDSVKSAVLLVL